MSRLLNIRGDKMKKFFSQKKIFLIATILFASILFASVHLLFGLWFGDSFVDVTYDKRYSLSPETVNFLKNNQKPITIRVYQSADLAQRNPTLGQYANYIRKLIHEYQKHSKGLIDVSFVEVHPFHSSQASAESAGIKEFNFGDGEKYLYFGASFTNEKGKSLTIPRFVPERYENAEDDITRLLTVLLTDQKVMIGIISPYFDIAENQSLFLRLRGAWPFIQELEQNGFEFLSLSEEVPYIPEYVDAVIVFYPLNYDRFGLYALDQYLVKGGKVLVLLDAFSEDRFRGQEAYLSYESGVLSLLHAYGIDYSENLLVGNNTHLRDLLLDGQKIKYPLWLSLEDENILPHPINKGIKKLYFNHNGFFSVEEKNGLKVTSLLETDENSGLMKAEDIADLSYENLLRNYQADFRKHALALLVEGSFHSVYQEPLISDVELLSQFPPFETDTEEKGKLLLVADTDMVGDTLWRDRTKIQQGAYGAGYSSDNLLFLRNALDYLTDSNYLNVPHKRNNQKQSLLDVFTRYALQPYQQIKNDILSRLAVVKNELSILAEEMSVNGGNIKQTKQKEEFLRQEASLRVELEKAAYQTKEHYQHLISGFVLVFVVFFPIVSALLLLAIYFAVNYIEKRKIQRTFK